MCSDCIQFPRNLGDDVVCPPCFVERENGKPYVRSNVALSKQKKIILEFSFCICKAIYFEKNFNSRFLAENIHRSPLGHHFNPSRWYGRYAKLPDILSSVSLAPRERCSCQFEPESRRQWKWIFFRTQFNLRSIRPWGSSGVCQILIIVASESWHIFYQLDEIFCLYHNTFGSPNRIFT